MAHHDGPRGAPSTSALESPEPQALGKPPDCGVDAPVGAVPAATHSRFAISSECSGAECPADIDSGARPPVAWRGVSKEGRAPSSSLSEEAIQQRDGARPPVA